MEAALRIRSTGAEPQKSLQTAPGWRGEPARDFLLTFLSASSLRSHLIVCRSPSPSPAALAESCFPHSFRHSFPYSKITHCEQFQQKIRETSWRRRPPGFQLQTICFSPSEKAQKSCDWLSLITAVFHATSFSSRWRDFKDPALCDLSNPIHLKMIKLSHFSDDRRMQDRQRR